MEAFGWYKETLIFLKDNKLILLFIVPLSGVGGHYLPKIATAKPVEVVINIPKNSEVDGLKKEIKRIKADIKKLKRWHGG